MKYQRCDTLPRTKRTSLKRCYTIPPSEWWSIISKINGEITKGKLPGGKFRYDDKISKEVAIPMESTSDMIN